MTEILPTDIPYELLGKVTFVFLFIVTLVVVTGVLVIGMYALWYRGLSRVATLMWSGYDIEEEYPPMWRRKIAVLCIELKHFRIRTIPETLRKIEDNQ